MATDELSETGILELSLLTAQSAGLPRADWQGPQHQWVPFEGQTPVTDGELVFRMAIPVEGPLAGGRLYLAPEFGAASENVFRACDIGAVINITR